MHLMQLAFLLGFASAIQANNDAPNYDYYLCRLRVTNISKSTVYAILDQGFDPQFEFTSASGSTLPPKQRTTFWLGGVPDESDIDVMYQVVIPRNAKISAVNYPDLQSIKGLPSDQFAFRCSNMTFVNTSDGITFKLETSYRVQLGGPQTSPYGQVWRPITLETQTQVDCYVKHGYEIPEKLDEYHRYVGNGEKFSKGCSYIGKCSNGEISAVSRCPPSSIPSTMVQVRKVGQCCDQSVTKLDMERKGCPKDERGSAFEKADNRTFVPWQVRFQKKDGSSQCDGVIIEKNWFLSTQSCLNDIKNIEFQRPLSVRYEPMLFRNVSIVEVKSVTDAKVDLALARIDLPFVIDDWSTQIQKVNLFWSQTVCDKFLQKDCHLFVGTEQKDDKNSPIVVGQIVDSPLNLKRIKKQQNLPILTGSGLAGWFEKANFLAGIYVGKASDGDTGDLISLCPFLESIQQKIK